MKVYLFCLFALTEICNGQTLKRQNISSDGKSGTSGGVVLSQTIGQPYHTGTIKNSNTDYRPGFQQSTFRTELISALIEVSLVPNPTHYSFYIESKDTLFNVQIYAYDLAGRLCYSEELKELKKHHVQCADWTNGLYMITVAQKKKNLISAKLVKQN